jgi:flagellar biosynthesis/type III secretory pathway protein FliH
VSLLVHPFTTREDSRKAHTARFAAHGREDGLREGRLTGVLEGQMLGCEKGFEIARELSYYAAFAATWRALTARNPTAFPERAQKQLEALALAAQSLPAENAKDVEMDRILEKARAKFRAASATLGVARLQRYIDTVMEKETRPVLSF